MRPSFVIVLALVLVLDSGCKSAPKRYLTPPSTVPVRESVADTRTGIAAAIEDARRLKEGENVQRPTSNVQWPTSNVQWPMAEGKILDSLTKHLLEAQSSNEQTEKGILILDGAIAKQTASVNSNAELAENAEAKAARNATWRNRFLLLAIGLLIFVFRKPLWALVQVGWKAARLAAGIP